jgi:hypothetical protein
MQVATLVGERQEHLPAAARFPQLDEDGAADRLAWADGPAGDGPADSPADRLLRKARLRINDWLLEAATPAAVLWLVSQHGESFNSVNVATALHRLARLVRASVKLSWLTVASYVLQPSV